MDKLVEIFKEHFGERLVSIGLHNIGVTSFLNKNGIFIVLDKVEPEDLLNIKSVYSKHKKQYSTPIVVNKNFFKDSVDVFCIEMLELKENAEILYGEDVFKDLEVKDEHLRRQLEYELRSKLLSLKGAFVDLPLDKKVIDNMTYRSMYNFLLILRNLLRLKGKLINDERLVEVFEETFNVKLSAFKALRDAEKLGFDKLLELFKQYLKEVEHLVEISDKILS